MASVSPFAPVPRTGVIYVMERARSLGFRADSDEWANLGQGAPETGDLPGSPERLTDIPVSAATSSYAPAGGLPELREAVAELYNHRFRRGKASKYTAANVAIAPGGRASLTRIAAVLDRVNLGHFLPDYTAYEELLDTFRDFVPIPILNPDLRLPRGDRLRDEIVGRGLGALLASNPCNPTGDVVTGDDLQRWVDTARDARCALIFDEFYSHFVYGDARPEVGANSAAACVDDVDEDMVLIVDGLTKNWRYPGLRLSWTLGPADVIGAITSAGSFLDGGAPHPIQAAAVPLLDPAVADAEAAAIDAAFTTKRDVMVERLRDIGFVLDEPPGGGFYCFAGLENLAPPLRSGMDFCEAALEHRVITVPGRFFDVNPGQRRRGLPSRLHQHLRLSFGPRLAEVERGLDALAELCAGG